MDASKPQVAAEAPAWYHPGRSGVIRLGPKNVLAAFGEIHPAVLDAMDVKGPLVGFEVFMDSIPLPKAKKKATRPPLQVSDLPAVNRDFAFVVETGVAVADIVRAAQGADKKLIERVDIFDVYEGERIGEGMKSIAIGVRMQPETKTLTDEEIDAVAAKIVANVKKTTGGELRG